MSYLAELANLMRLKVKGKTNEHHHVKSCLNRLNEMKLLLEKIRPMEKKMRYQLDKLLSSASSNSSSFAAGNGTTPATTDDNNMNDPLSFRPNPETLLSKGEEEDESDNTNDSDDQSQESQDDDDDDELKAAKAVLSSNGKKTTKLSNMTNEENTATGVYKAPRMASVPFIENQIDKQTKELQRQKQRMKTSEFLQTIQEQYGDKPEEDDAGATLGKQREAARRLAQRDAERVQYEEEAFVRLAPSRRDKKERNRIMREEVSNLNAIADIGNLAAGVSMAFDNDHDDTNPMDNNDSMLPTRYSNGKRRKDTEFDGMDNTNHQSRSRKRMGGKNSFQRTLYGQTSSKKKKRSKK